MRPGPIICAPFSAWAKAEVPALPALSVRPCDTIYRSTFQSLDGDASAKALER
jgi:hypothetical protein